MWHRRVIVSSLVSLVSLAPLVGCGSPRDTWVATMRVGLPMTVCNSSLFSECFAWTADECRELLRPEMEACIEEIEPDLPERIGPLQGSEWGEKLGACTGGRLEAAQIERVRFTPACEQAVKGLGHDMEGFRAEVAAIRAQRGLPPLE